MGKKTPRPPSLANFFGQPPVHPTTGEIASRTYHTNQTDFLRYQAAHECLTSVDALETPVNQVDHQPIWHGAGFDDPDGGPITLDEDQGFFDEEPGSEWP